MLEVSFVGASLTIVVLVESSHFPPHRKPGAFSIRIDHADLSALIRMILTDQLYACLVISDVSLGHTGRTANRRTWTHSKRGQG